MRDLLENRFGVTVYKFFYNLHFRYEPKEPVAKELVCEIDQLAVSPYGFFVIQTKNWSDITVEVATKDVWKTSPDKYPYNKTNLLARSAEHAAALKKFLHASAETYRVNPKFDESVFEVVVFTGERIKLSRVPQNFLYLKNLDEFIAAHKTEMFSLQDVDVFQKCLAEYQKSDEHERLKRLLSESGGESKDHPDDDARESKSQTASAAITAKNDALAKRRRNIFIGAAAGVVLLAVGGYAYVQIPALLRAVVVPRVTELMPALTPETETEIATETETEDATATAPKTKPAPEQNLRAQFLQELTQYENETEPKLATMQLAQWAEARAAELETLKTRAIEHFSASDYLQARESLRAASVLAEEIAGEYARELAQRKREANDAFADERDAEAAHAAQRALQLKPDDAEMLALQSRLAARKKVRALLRDADAARVENRPQKEIAALQLILALDPARADAAARLQKVRREVTRANYADAVRAARRALQTGALQNAAAHIARAKKISANGAEIAGLESALQKAKLQREFETEMAAGARAKQRDDWAAAAAHYTRAAQLQPQNKTALDNRNTARELTAIAQKINAHLSRPRRLEDYATADAVAEYLREVTPRIAPSPGLQKLHAQLSQRADAYRSEVEVTVVSDGKTHVSVRGIGQVGAVTRRVIRLRPGRRVFEGARRGYQSKLVTLDIMPGVTSAEVTVVCDEKI